MVLTHGLLFFLPFPRRRPYIPSTAIGLVPSLSSTTMPHQWLSLPRVYQHRVTSPQGSSSSCNECCCLVFRYPHGPTAHLFSSTRYWWHHVSSMLITSLCLSAHYPYFLYFLFDFAFPPFCPFRFFVSFLCSLRSFVDIPLAFPCPADHSSDWQPRILLCTSETHSSNLYRMSMDVPTVDVRVWS